MKFLKWLLYIVLIIVALILIIPQFLPSTVEVTSRKEVALLPYQVFHNAATYTDRDLWDPWLKTEPGAEFSIESQPEYVGSTYTWNGKKIKTGKMMVDSVVFGRYIASSIWFGKDPEPSLIEWELEPIDYGTGITWKFTAEGAYPIEKLMLNLMKGSMAANFKKGLDNLSDYLEENPPRLSSLGKIGKGTLPPMFALVSLGKGKMEEMGVLMGELYGKIDTEIGAQGLQMAGALFSHYLSFDEETGNSEFLAGIPVVSMGKDANEVMAKKYPGMEVIQAMHIGPYEELRFSYEKMMEYIQANQLDVVFEAFEFYYTDPEMEPDVRKWQTLIAFPLK